MEQPQMKYPVASLDKAEIERTALLNAHSFAANRDSAMAIKVAVLSRNPETLKDLNDYFAAQDPSIQLQIWPGDGNLLANMVEQELPAMLLLEQHVAREMDLEPLESIIRNHPGLPVVLLCIQPSREFLSRALHIGVAEIIPLPLTRPALESQLGRLRERLSPGRVAARRGSVMAFLPVKGGAGATFVAANLAHAVAAEGKRVCLIDLNLYFGVAALYVSEARPQATVADIAAQIQRLDGALLESSMLRISPNFWLLASPDAPEKAMDIRPESIERLLNVARCHYDFVMLDVSRALDANSIKSLDCADRIYLVMQTELPFIRDGGRLLRLFRSLGFAESRMQILVNRYEKGGEIGMREIERTLGKKVANTLPNSFGATAISINQGLPVLELAPRDPISRALREMARGLAQTEPESKNWLQRLKRRA